MVTLHFGLNMIGCGSVQGSSLNRQMNGVYRCVSRRKVLKFFSGKIKAGQSNILHFRIEMSNIVNMIEGIETT